MDVLFVAIGVVLMVAIPVAAIDVVMNECCI